MASNPIPIHILWWALSLGACLGGNLTMIGASANIVSVGIAKKFSQNISFSEFMKASSDVTNMLVRAKVVLKKNFKLIILKHDFVKTKLLVKTLSKARI